MDDLDVNDYEICEMEVVGDSTTVGASSSKGVNGDKFGRDQINHSSAQVTIPEQEGVATMPLDPVDEPYEGQQFDSEEAAYAFYNGYASRVGFAIRRTNLCRSRTDNSRIGQSFVCNRRGVESNNRRRNTIKQTEETKVGCKARIKLKKNVNSNKWNLVNFVKDQNHPLTPRKGIQDGLYDKFPSQHDKSQESSEQLVEEKKKSEKHKRNYQSKRVITKFVKDHNHPLTPGEGRRDGLSDDSPEWVDGIYNISTAKKKFGLNSFLNSMRMSQHDRDLSKQQEREKKKTAIHKSKAELLIEAYDEYQQQISKKLQEVIANVKEIEEEDARRAVVKENTRSDERCPMEK